MATTTLKLNLRETAEFFDIPFDTFTKWYKGGRNPELQHHEKKGNEVFFNIKDVYKYVVKKKEEQTELKTTQKLRKIVSTDEKELKLRKLQAETSKEELQVEKELGNLMPLDHIRKHIQNVFESLKAGIIQMPAKLCNELANEDDPNVIQAEIEQYCRQLMESIGDQIENYATQDN